MTSKGGSMSQRAFDCALDLYYQGGYTYQGTIDMLIEGNIEGAKAKIRTFGYKRRNDARIRMLDGNYDPSLLD